MYSVAFFTPGGYVWNYKTQFRCSEHLVMVLQGAVAQTFEARV